MRVKVGGTVRGVVEASSWAADQTQDFRATPRRGKAWVDVEGGGLLQRVGQWTENIGFDDGQGDAVVRLATIWSGRGRWRTHRPRRSSATWSPVARQACSPT
jgi:hypothetical protein